MTGFDDIKKRGFALDDMAQVTDQVLAAMVADERVAQAWEEDAFLDMGWKEHRAAMRRLWDDAKRETMAFCNRRFWTLNIERAYS